MTEMSCTSALIVRAAVVVAALLSAMPGPVICAADPGGRSAHTAEGWHLLAVPDAWRSVPAGPLAPVGGYSWFRALVKVPREWQESRLTVHVEALDDARATLVNGNAVGATGTFPPRFRSGLGERGRYSLDNSLVRFGDYNVIAIRVHQSDPRPNFSVAPPVLLNETRSEALRLEGAWQYRPGDDATWAVATLTDFVSGGSPDLSDAELAGLGVYRTIDPVDDIERYVTRRNGDTDPLSPAEAVRHFTTPDDLSVQLVLGEPEIAQPLFLMFDARERLWVMEYRQYPDPAGLTMVSRDVYLRSVYDKVPPPPPHHFRGRDRISIHADSDGDGVYDQHRIFVDELNLASSFAIGHGGVYVTNPPYLLFYPDADGDDVPDRDPDVLLEGFGIEDSHSVINSLRFGPDGWLYGCQGSTVSAAVRRPGSKAPPVQTQGQLIWRYHPVSAQFEVFAEGGGNTFGCEIDSAGRIFSGTNGGDTRGFHYVQGGYYRKGFGKHGPLSNPYAYGFFENMRHHSVARFTHNFILYEENRLPERYRGRLFGIEPLQGQVVLSDFRPFQSSFETSDIERVLKTDDPWFRPVDIKAGPDGGIYIADLYEQRIDHSSHYAGRIDRSSGRIYRLQSRERPSAVPHVPRDWRQATSQQLMSALTSPARWERQNALRLIGDRQDAALIPLLRDRLRCSAGQIALESLWALNLSGGFSDAAASEQLTHADPSVRAWTVRLLGDRKQVEQTMAEKLVNLARGEPSLDVRKQLAASARRLPAEAALPVIHALLPYDEDATDLHQPLLLWWAIEAQVGHISADQILQQLFTESETWQRPLVRPFLLERLMKRFAASGAREDLMSAAELLSAAPDPQSIEVLLKGFEEAFQGRSLAGIPDELAAAISASGGGSLALKVRQGQPEAVRQALRMVPDPAVSSAERRPLIEIFGQTANREALPVLLTLVAREQDGSLLAAVVTALQAFDDPGIGDAVVSRFSDLDEERRLAAESLLSSRGVWSRQLLQAVDDGRIAPDTITTGTLRKILLHGDEGIAPLVEKHWGTITGATTTEMLAEIGRVRELLQTGSGNPREGKRLFLQNCGRCHLLFEEGGRIGPDLTPFARDNLERMLASIVNPSLEIREGFENHLVQTADGRVLNGFLADRDAQVVILRGVDGQNVIVRQSEIEEIRVIPQSLMPEGALRTLTEQQLRDLFAYLRATQPVN